MSLFSGECQELAPCAVPVRQNGDNNYGGTTTISTSAQTHQHQSGNSARRKSSATAIEADNDNRTEKKGAGSDGENETGPEDPGEDEGVQNDESKIVPAPISSVTRVFKKCASNGSLALYVGTRTVTIEGTHLEPLKGIIVLDKESLQQTVSDNFRIWGQITLTFRYGREDEEVLGLRFCNEAILALKQLWPPLPKDPEDLDEEELTPLQGVLLERVTSSANSPSIHSVPFTLCAGPVGIGAFPPPPSVLLAPAKPYKGSPIGTLYDLRIYASERPEERPPRRNTIRLALRAVQTPPTEVTLDLKGSIESRPTILSRGKIKLQCELNTNAVRYGDSLEVKLSVQNNSRSSIRRIMVSLIQQVDVCMFTSGKFKNVVGCAEDNIFLVPGASYQKRYILTPQRGPARQWLALEEAFGREPVLSPSTCTDNLEPIMDIAPQKGANRSRNVFAIIVSYYVKAKLILGGLSLCQSLKVPFILLPPLNPDDPDPYPGVMTAGINFNPADVITTTACSTTPQKTAAGTSPTPPPPTSSQLPDVSRSSSNTQNVESPGGRRRRSQEQQQDEEEEDDDDDDECATAIMKRGVAVAQVVTSSSSTTTSISAQHLQHQPQIHHHHLVSSPATTPSPVKVPSVEHLF
ncbi:unnamed protein product [Orchesella dallaii]|uniref:Arrestin C-terminal-like domain-containing protein n=1 Tax=Orchesella dallaii TaxID=48710 RepID=A0ABP1S4G7_9HEXA